MERRKVIMHAQGILDGLTAAHQALSGDDSGEMMGAADLLGSVVNELAESARLDESLAPLSERLSDLYYGARELATDLVDRLDGYDFDPGELDQIEERLDQIYRMKQRYGASVEELLTRRDKAAEELEGYQSSGKRIAELTQAQTGIVPPDQGCSGNADPSSPESFYQHEPPNAGSTGIFEHARRAYGAAPSARPVGFRRTG